MFEEEFDALYRKQFAEAHGQRKDMLERDLAGTKKMLEVVYPILGSLDGIVLEHEMIALSGVKIYGDAFIDKWGTVLEEENYTTHAEMVTRKRFSFERARARSVAVFGYAYFPYGRDELEQQPEACRRDFRGLIFAKASVGADDYAKLPVLERETLRFALMRSKPFDLSALSEWLHLTKETTSKIARTLAKKGHLNKVGGGASRSHTFVISDAGRAILLSSSGR